MPPLAACSLPHIVFLSGQRWSLPMTNMASQGVSLCRCVVLLERHFFTPLEPWIFTIPRDPITYQDTYQETGGDLDF